MPVFMWKGLNLQGKVAHGSTFARSLAHLKKQLLSQNIGLLAVRRRAWFGTISKHQKYRFLEHLSSLINAHIPIHSALLIIASTNKHTSPAFKETVQDCAALVAEGNPLSESLKMHGLIDTMSYLLIRIGEKTGDIGAALSLAVRHSNVMREYKRTIHMNLLGPFMTGCFFLVVLVGFFIGVVPHLETYFASYTAVLPDSTKVVLAMSRFLRSYSAAVVLITCMGMGFLVYKLRFYAYVELMKDNLVMRIPFLRYLYYLSAQTSFFITLSVLMKHKIVLAEALGLMHEIHQASRLKREIKRIEDVVKEGKLLSLAVSGSIVGNPEIEAYLVIGESSGSLDLMIEQIADRSQKSMYAIMKRWSVIVQPLIMLVLGLLVALLICAIYVPLISLASVIE